MPDVPDSGIDFMASISAPVAGACWWLKTDHLQMQVHLLMHGHFQSHDKDSGHTIRSAVGINPMQHANLMALCFIEPELWPLKVLHCRNRDFQPFSFL